MKSFLLCTLLNKALCTAINNSILNKAISLVFDKPEQELMVFVLLSQYGRCHSVF